MHYDSCTENVKPAPSTLESGVVSSTVMVRGPVSELVASTVKSMRLLALSMLIFIESVLTPVAEI